MLIIFAIPGWRISSSDKKNWDYCFLKLINYENFVKMNFWHFSVHAWRWYTKNKRIIDLVLLPLVFRTSINNLIIHTFLFYIRLGFNKMKYRYAGFKKQKYFDGKITLISKSFVFWFSGGNHFVYIKQVSEP